MVLGACTYDTRFDDCAVHCTSEMECPEGLACAGGFCRTSGATGSCAAVLNSPSCEGLAATCGPNADEDCCAVAAPIPGGAFFRSYDVATDGMYPSTSYPATVSPFVLDRFEVTVGRFRTFVEAGMGTQVKPPPGGAGSHVRITSSGWDPSWNSSLGADTGALIASLKCDSTYETWTNTVSVSESLPINCVSWYEAMAFCVWDGGYLPTEAEWNFAAAGGEEQRAYPWSDPARSTAIDCSYANYFINSPTGTFCQNGTTGAVSRVGSESPKGDGRWNHSDLAGNVQEWTLDSHGTYSSASCVDCADLTSGTSRVLRGGSAGNFSSDLRAATRAGWGTAQRNSSVGFRCAHN